MLAARTVALLTAIPLSAAAQSPPANDTGVLRLSIEEAIRGVDRVSHVIASARASAEGAEADVAAARSQFFPQLTLNGSYLRTLRSEFDAVFEEEVGTFPGGDAFADLPFGRRHAWRVGGVANQLLWDAGRTESTVQIARNNAYAANLDVRQLRAQVVLEVAEAYFGAVLAARIAAIEEANLALADRTLEQTRLGYKQGTTAEFDVLRAEVTRDTQRTALIRARSDRDLAFDRLRVVLDVPFERPLVLTTTTIDAEHVARVARSAAGVSGGERVALSQASANVAIQRERVAQARAQQWPSLSLVADYNRVNYPLDWVPDGDWRTNWTVGVFATWSLFTGFRTTSEIRSAQAAERAAQERYDETVKQAAYDERRILADAEVARATLAELTRSTRVAERAYAIAELRYREGVSTYLELVDARLAFARAQIDQARAERDVAVARVRIVLLPALPIVTVGPAPSLVVTLPTTPVGAAPVAPSPVRESRTSNIPTTAPTQLPVVPR